MTSHCLSITLTNNEGLRLTIQKSAGAHNTATENEIRADAECRVNTDSDHSRYAPWAVTSSRWEY